MKKRISFSGIMDAKVRFIEKNQLMTKEDWSLFIHQFTKGRDTVDRGWRGEFFGKMMRGACYSIFHFQKVTPLEREALSLFILYYLLF